MKEIIYRIADALTGGRGVSRTINGFNVRFPLRFARYFPSDYEKQNFRFLREQVKPGDVVLDIGAHIGLFSVAASTLIRPTGKLFAFEPADQTIPLLLKTIVLNDAGEWISVNHAAIGKKSGMATFYVSDIKGDNSNSMVSYKEDRKLYPKQVALYSIDEFASEQHIEKVRFIKLDVEGVELDALKGAKQVLATHKPACIVAVHPEPVMARGDRLEDIYDLITSFNYHISDGVNPIEREAFCKNRDLIDLHITPKEKL